MPKIEVWIDTGFIGAEHRDIIEIDDDEWNALDQAAKDSRLEDEAVAFLNNTISYGAQVMPD